MKIAIANDVAMAAEALRRVVASTAEHQVLWFARTGAEAVRMCIESRPDLSLMDLNMPELDGVRPRARSWSTARARFWSSPDARRTTSTRCSARLAPARSM